MDAVDRIQQLLENIDSGEKNKSREIYINIIKNEFIKLDKKITIPKISVKELDYPTAVNIVTDAVSLIPEFLIGHRLMPDRKPASEQHSLQFIRRLRGVFVDFIHLFKIDLKFGGGAGEYIDRGDSNFYPSYYTNRFYYKSRLLPVAAHGGDPGFLPIRIFDSTFTESDQYFHTFAMFEDINYNEITREMHSRLGLGGVFPISVELFPFIEYEYFTGCLNVIHPVPGELETAVKIYEPLFLLLYSRYRSLDSLASLPEILSAIPELVSAGDGRLEITPEFIEELKRYFGRYSIFRDDDLAARGWWRIDCAE